jgi:hypothetical protein
MNYGRRLFQPQYRLELGRFMLRRLTGKSADRGKSETARLQCAQLAISPAEAVEALGMPASALRSFAADHAERLSAARARVEAARNSRMGGGADIDLLYSLCVTIGARRVLETGVAFGWQSRAKAQLI